MKIVYKRSPPWRHARTRRGRARRHKFERLWWLEVLLDPLGVRPGATWKDA